MDNTPIIVFLGSLRVGGTQRVAVSLCNYWQSLGYTVTLVSMSGGDERSFFDVSDGVEIVRLGGNYNRWGSLSNIIKVIQKCRNIRRFLKVNPNARIISLMAHVNILVLLSSIGIGSRIIVSERNYPPMMKVSKLIYVARLLLYPLAHKVVMQTNDGLTWLRAKIPLCSGVTIANPLTSSLNKSTGSVVSPEKLVGPNEQIVLAVGRLESQKNFQLLIDVFLDSGLMNRGWKLVILGEGAERGILESKIKSKGAQRAIVLPGVVSNLGDWYAAASIFVMTSRYEGFPNALLEAMSAGNAVISTDCKTGPSELIVNGMNGILVDPDLANSELVFQLRLLADSAEIRQLLALNARYVNESYSMRWISEQWLSHF